MAYPVTGLVLILGHVGVGISMLGWYELHGMVIIFPFSCLLFYSRNIEKYTDGSLCILVLGILRLNRARRSGLARLCVIGLDWVRFASIQSASVCVEVKTQHGAATVDTV